MNLLEKNPLGLTAAGFCALLLLISAALVFVWSRPASSGADMAGNADSVETAVRNPSTDLGPISQYKAVTERPLFEESRRPVVNVEVDIGDEDGEGEQQVSDAPEVTLSGVVITGDQRIATLRPVRGGESIIAQEGQDLGEDYPGWVLTGVEPRKIVIASLDGDSMELDLAINTRVMAEPPKPELPPSESDETSEEASSDDPPLSRAEEIRQRIAQRREELRRQAEENEQDEAEKMRSQYKNAIQNMIQRKDNNDENENEDKDGSGN